LRHAAPSSGARCHTPGDRLPWWPPGYLGGGTSKLGETARIPCFLARPSVSVRDPEGQSGHQPAPPPQHSQKLQQTWRWHASWQRYPGPTAVGWSAFGSSGDAGHFKCGCGCQCSQARFLWPSEADRQVVDRVTLTEARGLPRAQIALANDYLVPHRVAGLVRKTPVNAVPLRLYVSGKIRKSQGRAHQTGKAEAPRAHPAGPGSDGTGSRERGRCDKVCTSASASALRWWPR
jgi:hypothetical protein